MSNSVLTSKAYRARLTFLPQTGKEDLQAGVTALKAVPAGRMVEMRDGVASVPQITKDMIAAST
jgi:hypothetical protein